MLKGLIFFLLFEEIPKGFLISPRNIDNKSESNEDDVGPGPAPSPCRIFSPTGLPWRITAFITPFTLPIYEFLLTKHGWTASNNLLFMISDMPNNFILKFSWLAILISFNSIFSIPSIIRLSLDIVLLNAREDKILTLAKASKPFKSNFGFPGSAYPSNRAFFKTFVKFSLVFSISVSI